MLQRLPPWLQEWLALIVPAAYVLLVIILAVLLQKLVRRLLRRLGRRHGLPEALTDSAGRISGFVIYSAALLIALQGLGVDGQVLWAALTGFVAVAAIAFFAAWSVLSNIFCALLLYTTRPFRVGDDIELLENGEKPGLRGRVRDIGLVYTTLAESREDAPPSVLKVPNSLFFQRTVRRSGKALEPVADSAGPPE